MGSFSIGTFARRHRLALSLIAIVAASAIVLSACEPPSASASPSSDQSSAQTQR
jgi:hypothetical protein